MQVHEQIHPAQKLHEHLHYFPARRMRRDRHYLRSVSHKGKSNFTPNLLFVYNQLSKDRVSTFWETFSTVICFAFAVALVVAPVLIFVAGNRMYKATKADNKEDIAKHEALFDGKRAESWFAIQYNTIFFLRRYIVMATIVFFTDYKNT
jgi:hypothetical protein